MTEQNTSARAIALSVLLKIRSSGQYSNIALDTAIKRSELSEQDKGLATVLVYGVTERRLTLDYFIEKLSGRQLSEIDTTCLTLLEMGIYQQKYLDRIPIHASVYETVELAPKKSRGFVNAILREYSRRGEQLELPSEPLESMSVECSVPLPLCKKLADIYGLERAKSILLSSFDTERVCLRVNTLKTARDELKTQLTADGFDVSDGITATELDSDSGLVTRCRQFAEGDFFIQDKASQICVGAIGAQPGDTVIDACACPGSKSFGMAIDMNNQGRVIACDIHENKLSLVQDGAKRLGVGIIDTRTADARRNIPEFNGIADKVLCDVPCSGYGVISKKPEIRYKDPEESARLPEIQYAILENCSKYVKNGGVLVYSTCTILPCENADNIEKFLASHSEFSLEGFEVGSVCQSGMLSLLPDIDGTDGFFIAKFRKKS